LRYSIFIFLISINAFALTGTDPYFSKQTALHYARLTEALPLLLDEKTKAHEPVLIGVIDEGDINAHHPDMDSVLLPESDSTTRHASESHGQYVTGILAARSNNGVGISGAIGTHARVFYKQIHSVDDVVSDINMLSARGVAVINMSLGLNKPCNNSHAEFDSDKCQVPIATNSQISDAIKNAIHKYNTVFVISAGNEGNKLPRLSAMDDGLIVVGAMDEAHGVATYSNFGPGVSVFGPDFGVWGLTFNGYDHFLAATSFTTPLVTAAAAWSVLYLNAHGAKYTVKDIKSLILKSAHSQPRLADKAEAAGSLDYYSLATALQTFVARPKLLNKRRKKTE
jgi:subtilisin family serine protease